MSWSRRHWDSIPGSPEHLGVTATWALPFITLFMIVAAWSLGSFLNRNAREIVTTRCAQRWFEETTVLGGLTVEYESTSCDFSNADGETVGCAVQIDDFEPAYIECRLVSETLVFGSCNCAMPPAEAP